MAQQGEYMYHLTGRRSDDSTARFGIYKVGAALRIVPVDGGESTLVSKGRTLEGELRTVYRIIEIIESDGA